MAATRPVQPDTPVPPYDAVPPVGPVPPRAGNADPITVVDFGPERNKINMMDLGQVLRAPETDPRGAPNAFSMDDLEVARALTGLRSASPAHSSASATSSTPHPEPLISLLTSQHPLIASTIHNSLSAYSSSKTYSPRFRQGAEFVERNLASPMATTINTAGRISGVETGVRWMLRRNASNTSDDEDRRRSTEGGRRLSFGADAADDASNKRRRLDPDAMEVERGAETPASEFLPAYDAERSPRYEEYAMVPTSGAHVHAHPPIPQNWQTRLMISTSGLGVAMSDESLRSLKYCLNWLRWANTHLNRVLASLQSVLHEWERSQAPSSEDALLQSPPLSPTGTTTLPDPRAPPRDAATIAKHLSALRGECVRTLKSALDVVSTYAGGALPENARHLVRRHLTSLPLRFQLASNGHSQPPSAAHSRRASTITMPAHPDGPSATHPDDVESQAAAPPEAVSGAQRVVVLAREGLDMMAQVSAVVDGTIVSAEAWCERLGRRARAELGEKETEGGVSEAERSQVQGGEKRALGEMERERERDEGELLVDVRGNAPADGDVAMGEAGREKA